MAKDDLQELRDRVKSLQDKEARESFERSEASRKAKENAEGERLRRVQASTERTFDMLKGYVASRIMEGFTNANVHILHHESPITTLTTHPHRVTDEVMIHTYEVNQTKLLELCSTLARELNCSLVFTSDHNKPQTTDHIAFTFYFTQTFFVDHNSW